MFIVIKSMLTLLVPSKLYTMVVIKCIIFFVAVTGALSLQIFPERAYVKYVNEKYAKGTKFYIQRHSRRSQYYINLEGWTKQQWGNNVSVDFYFYEYLHNEYKRSFVELHYTDLCDWISQDPYIGAAIRDNRCFDVEEKKRKGQPYGKDCETALKCPLPAGFYKLNNVSVPGHSFPNVWPFEKFRVDISARAEPSGERMFELQAYASIKQSVG